MLTWIIPYLVAYNASSTVDWAYGPEHVFKAQVDRIILYENDPSRHRSRDVINFVCRPINSTSIKCRIDSTLQESNSITGVIEECGLDGTVFQIEYDAVGISKVSFFNNNRTIYRDMIHAIIGTMNVGIDVTNKTVGIYVYPEKSIIGICNTTLTISKNILSESDKLLEIEIEGYEFDVPSLISRTDNKTIFIEKIRNLSECKKKIPYNYGELREFLRSPRLYMASSLSQFYLGERSFSSYTETSRRILDPAGKESGSTIGKVQWEMISVDLKSIRPATDEPWTTENSMDDNEGYDPNSPWQG